MARNEETFDLFYLKPGTLQFLSFPFHLMLFTSSISSGPLCSLFLEGVDTAGAGAGALDGSGAVFVAADMEFWAGGSREIWGGELVVVVVINGFNR